MSEETLREELARIDREIETLEVRKRDIYKRSLTAPDEQRSVRTSWRRCCPKSRLRCNGQ